MNHPQTIPINPKRVEKHAEKHTEKQEDKKYSKQKIPKAVREQVWVQNMGNVFETRCYVPWCKNKITCFNFHVGHDQPESKGGTLSIKNLKPICDRCNFSMGDRYTIQEWSDEFTNKRSCGYYFRMLFCCGCFGCFRCCRY